MTMTANKSVAAPVVDRMFEQLLAEDASDDEDVVAVQHRSSFCLGSKQDQVLVVEAGEVLILSMNEPN